jgi:Fe-S-cluster containining protein
MILEIDGVFISDEIINKRFVCNLNACKGACCWEGDFGAPVTSIEMKNIEDDLENIKAFLPEKSIKIIETIDPFKLYNNDQVWGTALHDDGACVFLTKNSDGIAQCGIEKAYKQNKSAVNKPISCHMYPIRVQKNEIAGFEAWNYEEWDICSAACKLGDELKVPIYQFLKDSIIRYKGAEFYDRLAALDYNINDKE